MKLLKNKRGTIMLYITFIILAVIIITISAVVAPMGVLFNTKMYQVGEQIILDANESISAIDNSTVRTNLQTMFSNALGNTENNIEVNNSIFQYGWIIVLVLTGLVLFIYTRRLVEVGSSGGFI